MSEPTIDEMHNALHDKLSVSVCQDTDCRIEEEIRSIELEAIRAFVERVEKRFKVEPRFLDGDDVWEFVIDELDAREKDAE